MTHDELMAKVHSVFYEEEGGTQLDIKTANNQYRALYAVVELHKPGGYEYFEKDICEHCTLDIDYYIFYPCPTIEAIEKELSNV
jgi:hypothetical protein